MRRKFTDQTTGFTYYGDAAIEQPSVSAERREFGRSLGYSDEEIDRLFYSGRRPRRTVTPNFNELMSQADIDEIERKM